MGTRIDEYGLKKGPWTPEEDQKLVDGIQKYGHGNWKALPQLAGLNRCGKSCRLRWTNYLRPDIKRGAFTEEEERLIIDLHQKLGNKWSAIAGYLPGRTDNEIKNFWNTRLKRKLVQNGIDPDTHLPRTHLNTFLHGLPQFLGSNDTRNLTWENAAVSQAYAARLAKAVLICKILQLLSTGHSPPLAMEAARVMNGQPWDCSKMGLQSGFKDVSRPVNESMMEIDSAVEMNMREFGGSSIMQIDYTVPDLVSASPECFSRDQETNSFISPNEFSNPASTSDPLGDFADDEARNSYWKQLLEGRCKQMVPWECKASQLSK